MTNDELMTLHNYLCQVGEQLMSQNMMNAAKVVAIIVERLRTEGDKRGLVAAPQQHSATAN